MLDTGWKTVDDDARAAPDVIQKLTHRERVKRATRNMPGEHDTKPSGYIAWVQIPSGQSSHCAYVDVFVSVRHEGAAYRTLSRAVGAKQTDAITEESSVHATVDLASRNGATTRSSVVGGVGVAPSW